MEPWLLLFFDNQTALQVSSFVGFLLLAFFIFYFFYITKLFAIL